MKEKVLIVDDEKDIVKMLDYNLKKEGYGTIVAYDGEAAMTAVKKERPGLILLDLMLPGIDGIEVCKKLKSEKANAPMSIIMLTARSQESDKIVGLELGADDYVTKPFSIRELMARIKAVFRRMNDKDKLPDVLRTGDLTLDFLKLAVFVKDKPVELASKEFELLKILVMARGRVLSRDHILGTVWGADQSLEIQTRTVDVHIGKLRKKLGSFGENIVTVKSYGYRLNQ